MHAQTSTGYQTNRETASFTTMCPSLLYGKPSIYSLRFSGISHLFLATPSNDRTVPLVMPCSQAYTAPSHPTMRAWILLPGHNLALAQYAARGGLRASLALASGLGGLNVCCGNKAVTIGC